MKRISSAFVGIVLLGIGTWLGTRASQPSPRFVPYRFETTSREDPSRALEFYEERVRLQPESGLELAQLAGAYLGKGLTTHDETWFSKAEEMAEGSLALLPYGNTAAKLVLAEVADGRHNFHEAIRLADNLLKEKPGDEGALSVLVTTNLGLKNFEEAAQAAEALVLRRPSMGALTLRALVRDHQGRDREAIRDFEAALRAEDIGMTAGSAWTRLLYSHFLFERGYPELARLYCQEGLRIQPESAQGRALWTLLEKQSGR